MDFFVKQKEMKKMMYILVLAVVCSVACSCHQEKNCKQEPIADFAAVETEQADTNKCVFITYRQPLNGYRVKVGVRKNGKSNFFLNDTMRFTIEGWGDARLFSQYDKMVITRDTVLDYVPPKSDEPYLSALSPFYFSDVDFDGEEEFIVNLYKYGTYGSNLYAVFEKGFKLRKDTPFIYLQNEQTVFDAAGKTILLAGKDTNYTYQGVGDKFIKIASEAVEF